MEDPRVPRGYMAISNEVLCGRFLRRQLAVYATTESLGDEISKLSCSHPYFTPIHFRINGSSHMHLDLLFLWLTSLVSTFFPGPTLECQILDVKVHQTVRLMTLGNEKSSPNVPFICSD